MRMDIARPSQARRGTSHKTHLVMRTSRGTF